jgi:2-dehydropantoate 2-reductase
MNTVRIYGAGAIGCYYGARLQQGGLRVQFLARGDKLELLRQDGLHVSSPHGDFSLQVEAHTAEEISELPDPDLSIVSVKTYSSPQIIPWLPKMGPVLVIQNGVRSEEAFRGELGEERIHRGVSYLSANMETPNRLRHNSGERLYIEARGYDWEEELRDILDNIGLEHRFSSDIRYEIWRKCCRNAAFNSICALSRATTGPMLDDPEGRELFVTIIDECASVAAAEGVQLPPNLGQDTADMVAERVGDIMPSTLEDVLKSRPLEYEAIIGDILGVAKAKQVDVPHLETASILLKLLSKQK